MSTHVDWEWDAGTDVHTKAIDRATEAFWSSWPWFRQVWAKSFEGDDRDGWRADRVDTVPQEPLEAAICAYLKTLAENIGR